MAISLLPTNYYVFSALGAGPIVADVIADEDLTVSGGGGSIVAAQVGSALRFNGTSTYASRSMPLALRESGHSGAVAFKVDATGGATQYILFFATTGANAFVIQASSFSGGTFTLKAGSSSPTTVATGLSSSSEHFVVWTHTVDNRYLVSLNGGALTQVGAGLGEGSAVASFYLGSTHDPASFIKGDVDELAFWDSIISSTVIAEIAAHWSAGHRLDAELNMANLTSTALLRIGAHTSNTQVEVDTSVSYIFQEYEGPLSYGYADRKVERDLHRGDNERYSRVTAGNNPPTLGFRNFLRGLNSNSGGAVTIANQTELSSLLAMAFGVAGAGGTGSTAVTSGSTSTTLIVADASSMSAGGAVLFNDGTELIARAIVSKSSNTLTLDRAYSGTPTNSSTVYSAVSWYPDLDAPNHTHVAADLEFLSLERVKMYGLMGGFEIDFPANGGLALCSWQLDGTEFDDDEALAAPTFTAPTVGSEIPCLDATFWIGSNERLLRDAKLIVDVQKAPKTTYSALNGHAGYVVTDVRVRLEGTLYMGGLTSELTTSARATLQSSTTQDIALQVGRTAGASVYLRMPNADFDAQKTTVDGMDVVRFTAHATRSSNHSNVPGGMRLHLF